MFVLQSASYSFSLVTALIKFRDYLTISVGFLWTRGPDRFNSVAKYSIPLVTGTTVFIIAMLTGSVPICA